MPIRGSLLKNVCPALNESDGSGSDSGATKFNVALGELVPVHRWNECEGVSRSTLSKSISSRLQPMLKRIQEVKRPFSETYGLREFSVTSFAVSWRKDP